MLKQSQSGVPTGEASAASLLDAASSPVARTALNAADNKKLAAIFKKVIPGMVDDINSIEQTIDTTLKTDRRFYLLYQTDPATARKLLIATAVSAAYKLEIDYDRMRVGITLPANSSCYEFLKNMQQLSIALYNLPCISPHDLRRWSKDEEFTKKHDKEQPIVVVAKMPNTVNMDMDAVENMIKGRQVMGWNLKPASLPHLAVTAAVYAALESRRDLFEGNVMKSAGGSLYMDKGQIECGIYDRQNGSSRSWIRPEVQTAVEFDITSNS